MEKTASTSDASVAPTVQADGSEAGEKVAASRAELIWPSLARAGLDIELLKTDMQSPDIARVIAQDVADARTLNVTKTPEYFVNGRPLPSFGFEQLRTLVDEELAATSKAKAG